jgi:hypothetical protein
MVGSDIRVFPAKGMMALTAVVMAVIVASVSLGASPAWAAKKKKKAPPAEAKAPVVKTPETIYAGEWNLMTLDGKKMPPYWTASVHGLTFVLNMDSPGSKCVINATMALEGRDVTLLTTSADCQGDKAGDVDEGQFTLHDPTLTFISKTHGKKWVFVRKMEKKPEAVTPSADEGDLAAAPRPPAPREEPSAEKLVRITLTKPDTVTPMGEVEFVWDAQREAIRYFFVLDGKEDKGDLIDTSSELFNSSCDVNICRITKKLTPGYYTGRVDAVFNKRAGTKVKISVGAPEEKKGAKGKGKPASSANAPAGIIGPVGRIAEASVSEFKWNAVPGGSTYEVHVQKAGAGAGAAKIQSGDKQLWCKDEVCSVTLKEPVGPGDYIWWVETEILSHGKPKSFSVRGNEPPPQPKPVERAPAPVKKKKSWREGPGGGL